MRNFFRELSLSTPKLDTSAHMRSFVLTKTWSRSYQHKEFFIDLFFSGNRHGASIYGQLLGQPGYIMPMVTMILMHTSNEEFLEEVAVDTRGQFKFVMQDPGNYQLLMDLQGDVAGIETIAVQ